MADPVDDRISRAYRDMPGDEPPPALNDAIRAAARRAVRARPGFARRWQLPISIAAVLVLAVGVALQVEREQPAVNDGASMPAASPASRAIRAQPDASVPTAPERAAPAEPPRKPERGEAATPAISPPAGIAAPARAPKPTPPAPAFVPAPARQVAPAPAPRLAPLPSPGPADAAPAPAEAAGRAAEAVAPMRLRSAPESGALERQAAEGAESPERSLERIAELRSRGRHDEADRALADFRRTFPDYRISPAWLRRVERQ